MSWEKYLMNKNNWNLGYNFYYKIFLIFSYCCTLLALSIILRTPTAQSFEFSIYDVYPGVFWLLIIVAISIGQILMIVSAFSDINDNHWVFAFFSIMICNIILIFMPLIRGYLIFGTGDVLTHIGIMKNILSSSHFENNFYPIAHILGVETNIITNISINDITTILPPIIGIFFIFSFYILARTIFSNKKDWLLILVFGSILLSASSFVMFAPSTFSIFILPFIIYLYFKYNKTISRQKEFLILLILFCIFMVFVHPLTAIQLIFILFCLKIANIVQNIFIQNLEIPIKISYLVSIIFIVLVSWTTFVLIVLGEKLTRVIDSVSGVEQSQSQFKYYSQDVIAYSGFDLYSIIDYIVKIYGRTLIIVFLCIVSLYFIYKTIRNNKSSLEFGHFFLLIVVFFYLFLCPVLFFISIGFGWGRMFEISLIFSILLIPTSFTLIFYPHERKLLINLFHSWKPYLLFICILFLTIYSVFLLYPSPIIKYINEQVPMSDYQGMDTFFSYKDTKINTFELGLFNFRYNDAINGRDYTFFSEKQNVPQNHFGYQKNSYFGDLFNNENYFILNDQGKNSYSVLSPTRKDYTKWRFWPEDFVRLGFDPSVNQIYSNDHLSVFLISPRLS